MQKIVWKRNTGAIRNRRIYGISFVMYRVVLMTIILWLTIGAEAASLTIVSAQSISSNEIEDAYVEISDEILEEETTTIKYSGTDGNLSWTIDTDGHLTVSGQGDYETRSYPYKTGWLEYKEEIKAATVTVTEITSTAYMFYGCNYLTSLNVSGLDTSAVTDMECMFRDCSRLMSLDLSGFDTSAVRNMSEMFCGCATLTSLDLSSFDARYEDDMFLYCWSLSQIISPKSIRGTYIPLPQPEDGFGWYNNLGKLCNNMISSRTYTKRKQMSSENTVIAEIQPVEFMGNAIQPPIMVTCDGIQLQNGTDYTVTYQNNSNVGKATVRVSGQGFYVGDFETAFEITPKNLGVNAQISLSSVDYFTGSEIKPTVAVICDGVILQQETDYTVSYANNINPGTATVTVIGQGNYTGSVQADFQIKCILEKTKIDAAELVFDYGNLKKLRTKSYYSLCVDFKPVSYATGYEIELTDYNGKKIKSVTGECTGKEYVEKKISNLAKDVYGVRIRCSRDGEYGEWSDTTYVIKQPKAQARNYKGNIQIKWQKLSGVSGYEIYMGTSKTGKLTKVATVGKKTTLKTIKKIGKKKLKKGTYYYYVLAVKKVNGKNYKSKVGFKYNIKKK